MKFKVTIEPGRESGFIASCPELPGCIARGATREEAAQNIGKAIAAYLQTFLVDECAERLEEGAIELDISVR